MRTVHTRGSALVVLGTCVQLVAFLLIRNAAFESVGAIAAVLGTSLIAVGMWSLLRRTGRSLSWCLLSVVPLVALAGALIWMPRTLGDDDDSVA